MDTTYRPETDHSRYDAHEGPWGLIADNSLVWFDSLSDALAAAESAPGPYRVINSRYAVVHSGNVPPRSDDPILVGLMSVEDE